MRKLKLLLVTLALIVGGASYIWAGTTDYTSEMSNAQGDWTNASGTNSGGAERYNGNDNAFQVGDVLYQTINGLPDGYYEVCVYAWENFSNWNDNANIAYGNNIAQVFANDAVKDIHVIKNTGGRAKDDANKYTLLAKVTGGTLKYGIKNIAAGGNWAVCIADKLTYLGGEIDANTDLTYAINNFDFKNCSNNDFPGWTIEAPNGGNTWKNSDTRVEYWIGSAVNGIFDYYQTLTNLPGGKYTLSAYMWNSTDNENGATFVGEECGVYGTSSNGTVFKGVNQNTRADGIAEYTTNGLLVTDGTMRIGVKNNTTMTARWFGVDWIKLKYLGRCLANDAVELPDEGDMEAGKWYYFDITAAADNYLATATALDGIICTTDGTQLTASATGDVTLAAENNSFTVQRYYVKSSSDNNLKISVAAYSYSVSAATADISYIQEGSTVTVSFTTSTNDPDATLTQNYSSVTFNGETVTCTPTTSGFTFTVPTVTANTNYTLAIPAGAIKYNDENKNATQNITLTTPAILDGTYYLYDATNKKFLSRGKNYGSRAVVDLYGLPFNVTTNGNNESLIAFRDWPNVNIFFDNNDHTNCWLYTDGGSDKGDNRLFAFEATTGGYYLRDAAKAVYIKHDNSVLTVPTTTIGEATVWSILSKAERDAIVNTYPTTNKSNVIAAAGISTTVDAFEDYLTANYAAKDKTSLVGTAKFTEAGGNGDWAVTGTAKYGNDWTEGFENAVTWSQTISGLPAGIYKVTVNGFERKAGYALCNTLAEQGYQPVTAYIMANNEQLPLKSWYSDKTGTNNPNGTGEAATAFNNDKYKNTIYTYVGTDGNLTLTIGKQDKAAGSWVLFNNVTLTFYDASVSDEESTVIIAEAETEMAKPMKPTLYQALAAAKTAFEGAKTVPNYNALRTAIDNTATSVASYASMNTNYLEPIADVLSSSNIIDQTSSAYTDYVAYKAKYDNYKNAETADIENETANALTLWQGSGARYTNIGNILMATGWKIGGADALTNNSGFYTNVWSTENDGEAPAKDFARPFYEMWVNSGSITATTLTRTITGLIANGVYKVTANVRVQGNDKVAGSITLKAGEGTAIDVTAGNKIGSTSRYIGAYTAFGKADADGKLTITITVAADSKVSWLAFRDVNCDPVDASDIAQPSDYTALSDAINTAEGKTLGFENGDYAPYNNIAALEALAAAKAIDQTAINLKATVTSATTALTSATWTVNTEEMNAIDNGNFATAEDRGWAFSAWGQFVSGLNTNTNASNGTARSSNSGTLTYGEKVGYTMPLKANTKYTLTFKVASWDDSNKNTGTKVSVLNSSSEGLAETSFDARNINRDQSGAFVTYNADFTTGAAGDYTLVITAQGNRSVYTDIVLKRKTASANMTITSAKYATFIAPFDVAIPSGVTASKVLAAEDKTLTLTPVETTIPANTPVVLYKDVTGADFTQDFNGADRSTKNTYTVGLLTGVYEDTPATAGTYVLQNQSGTVAFYKVTSGIEPTVGKNRAYVNAGAFGAGIKAFFFDEDETTAIEGLDVLTSGEYDAIYNAAGIQVEALQKGLNIVVKDGKSYKIYVK